MTLQDKVKNLKVEELFSELRITKVYKKKLPEYLSQSFYGTDILIINPQNDMNSSTNQPLVVVPANDFLKMLQETKYEKRN